jgi:hypothetical protein
MHGGLNYETHFDKLPKVTKLVSMYSFPDSTGSEATLDLLEREEIISREELLEEMNRARVDDGIRAMDKRKK